MNREVNDISKQLEKGSGLMREIVPNVENALFNPDSDMRRASLRSVKSIWSKVSAVCTYDYQLFIITRVGKQQWEEYIGEVSEHLRGKAPITHYAIVSPFG